MFSSDTKTSPRLGLQELVQSQLLMKEWRINLRFDNIITFKTESLSNIRDKGQECCCLKKNFELLHQREEEKKSVNP